MELQRISNWYLTEGDSAIFLSRWIIDDTELIIRYHDRKIDWLTIIYAKQIHKLGSKVKRSCESLLDDYVISNCG